MITLGIDLAAQPKGTAACRISWSRGRADVSEVVAPASDDAILRLIATADKVGIDVPFGWPDEFVEAVSEHRAGRPWPEAEGSRLRLRETDRVVKLGTPSSLQPLSVSSNFIAITAMKGARLMSSLAEPVDRAGGGRLVEVYPAAALDRWGLTCRGYKGSEPGPRDVRAKLVSGLLDQIGWLAISETYRSRCEQSDHVLDALVAALVTRAAVIGACDAIPPDARERARREGWIALPAKGSLAGLAHPDVPPSEA